MAPLSHGSRARPAPVAGAPADPAFEAAKATFEALPEADRKAVQDALVWTGDFNAVVSGAFGRRTFEALNANGDVLATATKDGNSALILEYTFPDDEIYYFRVKSRSAIIYDLDVVYEVL